jgi:3-oxoacyl-[acyl-carrier protein] reductase
MRLAKKKAMVTGAGRGIGRAIAIEFAKEGADVAINDLELEDARRVADEIESMGREAMAVKGDVADYGAVRAMMKEVFARFGRIDILVNNAGIASKMPLTEMSKQEWDRMIDVLLNGNFHCAKEVIGRMIEQRSGRIITISSVFGMTGFAEMVHYSAAKGGIIAFTKALAKEVAQYGITVNSIAPGNISTKMHESVPQSVIDEIVQMTPVGRLGRPEEVGHLAVYLASEEASFVTGQMISPNGGLVM